MTTAWEKVERARSKNRINTQTIFDTILTDFTEFHGDRYFGDDPAIKGGIGMLKDMPVTVIGVVKGRDTEENLKANFGMVHPEGYRKALRLMKQAEKFKRPIITFIDTPGAYPGIGAEERGQGEAIAQNLMQMMTFEVPIIAVIIGEAGSGGALALAVANEVWMLENSIYSILSPEGFASILYKDASRAKEIVDDMKITSDALLTLGIIDDIIVEHDDNQELAQQIGDKLYKSLLKYKKKRGSSLVKHRYERFRNMGEVEHGNK
ncbi:acetyl-CoA carboxylase carboxyltransferase subunit alpha [Erysipelothrix aquatica]|uniref:acetyl-CoA carboxylase carboxyltransferase subunit alpha n=1 Tax=Erysipelothrix aquatica TaxID=2683714 RepID=UPI00135779A5|nr:acetyl-CoA carboxylase carboxyltransferase subunit alpha [Erysipelothrix aquatica]